MIDMLTDDMDMDVIDEELGLPEGLNSVPLDKKKELLRFKRSHRDVCTQIQLCLTLHYLCAVVAQ